MRRLAALAAAVTTAAFLCAAPAWADTRAQQWRALAEQALIRAESLDTGAERVAVYAFMLQGASRLYGWTDPRAQPLLSRIYSLANPDGGYGLGFAWDALSDGTINDADTTYTVTLAGHVGPVLLEGYRAGVVPRERVQQIVSLLWTTPRVPGPLAEHGACLASSRHPNDRMAYGCVHNVNAGAGRFLSDAGAAGITRSGVASLVVGITRREVHAYRPETLDWLYMDTRLVVDQDHLSYQAESMYQLAPAIGAEVAYRQMVRELDDPYAAVIHARLTGLPPTPGRTQWCVMGDRWLPEVAAYLQTQRDDAGRQAQIAWYAAVAAQSCEGTP